MYLRIILILCAVVSGVSRISEPDLNAVNFADNIAGRKLNKSLISEMEVDSETSCQFECVEEERCQSYNFRTIKGDSGKFKCQLSDSDRFFGFANFTEDKDFIYRGLMSACEEDRFQCGKNGICIPNYVDGSARCKCDDGYTGKPCKGKSCSQLFQDGFNVSGLYTINPDGGKPIQVLCDMTTDGGGWTVFQRRLDGSVDFYLGWESYKNGFGNLNGEFWLGNDNLHLLTAVDNVMMRVDLEDFDGNITYAEYKTFKVAGEADKYQLLIGGYNGTAGDSDSHDWSSYFNFVVQNLEGKTSEEVSIRQEALRKKVTHILSCDIGWEDPVKWPSSWSTQIRSFDVITTNLCLEASVTSTEDYRHAIAKLSRYLKAGGYFVMLGVLGESFYMVGNEKFYCFPLSKSIIEETFAEEGYQILDLKVFTLDPTVTKGNCNAEGLFFFRGRFDEHA